MKQPDESGKGRGTRLLSGRCRPKRQGRGIWNLRGLQVITFLVAWLCVAQPLGAQTAFTLDFAFTTADVTLQYVQVDPFVVICNWNWNWEIQAATAAVDDKGVGNLTLRIINRFIPTAGCGSNNTPQTVVIPVTLSNGVLSGSLKNHSVFPSPYVSTPIEVYGSISSDGTSMLLNWTFAGGASSIANHSYLGNINGTMVLKNLSPLTIEQPPNSVINLGVGQTFPGTQYCFKALNGVAKEWTTSRDQPTVGIVLESEGGPPYPAFLCMTGVAQDPGVYLFTVSVTSTDGRSASRDVALQITPTTEEKHKDAVLANALLLTSRIEPPPGALPEDDHHIGDILGMAEYTLALVYANLAADPPRTDYTVLASPTVLTAPTLPAGTIFGPYRAELQQLVQTDFDAHGVATALLASIEREQGATAAGDTLWATQQHGLAQTLRTSLDALLRQRLTLLQQLKTRASSDTSIPVITPEWTDAAAKTLRTAEFRTQFLADMIAAGLPPVDADKLNFLALASIAPDQPQPLFEMLATTSEAIKDLFAPSVQPISWSGVLQPINASGNSVFKSGSTVPVKFALTGGNAGTTDLAATLTFQQATSVLPGVVNEAISTSAATTGNLFRYDASSGQYIFNWSTKGLSPGVYALSIALGDGITHTVQVGLR